MVPIVVRVPGPPKAKGRHHTRVVVPRNGGQPFAQEYPDEKTEIYENLVKLSAVQAMGGRPALNVPLVLSMWAFFPIPSGWPEKRKVLARLGAIVPAGKPDLDNILKVKDGMKGIVWTDDSRVVDYGTMSKRYADMPRLVFRVSLYVPPEIPDDVLGGADLPLLAGVS